MGPTSVEIIFLTNSISLDNVGCQHEGPKKMDTHQLGVEDFFYSLLSNM